MFPNNPFFQGSISPPTTKAPGNTDLVSTTFAPIFPTQTNGILSSNSEIQPKTQVQTSSSSMPTVSAAAPLTFNFGQSKNDSNSTGAPSDVKPTFSFGISSTTTKTSDSNDPPPAGGLFFGKSASSGESTNAVAGFSFGFNSATGNNVTAAKPFSFLSGNNNTQSSQGTQSDNDGKRGYSLV